MSQSNKLPVSTRLASRATPPLGLAGERPGCRLICATEHGVLVHAPIEINGGWEERVSLLSSDLSETRWTVPGSSSAVCTDGQLWLGPFGGAVRRIDWTSGEEVARFPTPDTRVGAISGVVGDQVVLNYFRHGYAVFSRDGKPLWQRPISTSEPTLTPAAYLFREDSGRLLIAIEATSGVEMWRKRFVAEDAPRDRGIGRELLAGYQSVSCVGQRVMVVRGFGDAAALDLMTGEELASGATSMPGHYQVTGRHVLFFSGLGLAVFDAMAMVDVARIDLREEIAASFGDAAVTIRGFAASRNAVFWTAPEGVLMGVSLKDDGDGVKRRWRTTVPGLSPISVAPALIGDFMYWTTTVVPPDRSALFAFRG